MSSAINPWNGLLRDRASRLEKAYRGPISPGCLLPTAAARAAPANPQSQRKSLLSLPINCNTVGDNLIIPTIIGRKLIYELVLWNVAAQTLAFWYGPSASGILLLRLTSFPALTGFTLGFNGNFSMPHFDLDPGQPLVLTLASSTQVDGMIRYRNETTGNF